MISVPDPNCMMVRECKPLSAEFVMRSYLTGVTSTSIWRAYERGDREFCGHSLPDGMRKNDKLPEPLLTRPPRPRRARTTSRYRANSCWKWVR